MNWKRGTPWRPDIASGAYHTATERAHYLVHRDGSGWELRYSTFADWGDGGTQITWQRTARAAKALAEVFDHHYGLRLRHLADTP